MTINKPIIDPMTEWMMEECWRLSCKFMHEIEYELQCQGKFPINLLLASQNLVAKWLEFAGRN